ncbi:MAG: thioredoxin domain-containing protein [Bacteroidota bacterium]
MSKHQNALSEANSPYLQQHAHNPVDWVEWSEAAFQKAEKENKLVLISIGYSACHWCHVMERESFEDESVAELMNRHFVCIKVDREERPDVDQVYMNAVQLMTQQGGWPLNCFALPDGRPIYGGTYFPREQWTTVLEKLWETYEEDRAKVLKYAEKLTEGVQVSELVGKVEMKPDFDVDVIHSLVKKWKQNFDFDNGGNRRAPKFPLPNNYEFLLRYGFQNSDSTVLNHVRLTLEKMAHGGIYDQLIGGFSRYSVDMVWKVPHFEKMLYDNGQLLSLYAQAYQHDKQPLYADVLNQTIDWLVHEMQDEEGGFFSALDADSEGVEGKFYTWTKDELAALLGDDFDWYADFYNINNVGYWENDQYILMRTQTKADFAKSRGWNLEDFEKRLESANDKLRTARKKRIRPGLDDKKITAWNAMTIKGLALSGLALNNTDYIHLATETAEWLIEHQMKNDGSLWRTRKSGRSSIDAFLEDYAHVIDAFSTLYEITLNERWLAIAKKLLSYTQNHFQDESSRLFYFTKQNKDLIARKMEINDNVIPASNSVMGNNLFTLGKYYYDEQLITDAQQMLSNIYDQMPQYGAGYSNWALLALNFSMKFRELAIMGENAVQQRRKLGQHYMPNTVIAGGNDNQLPFLKDKPTSQETLFYVCENYTCKAPVKTLQAVVEELGGS